MSTQNRGTCPCCTGTKRMPVPTQKQSYKKSLYGYEPTSDTLACSNCGSQYMFGQPSGVVSLRSDGTPCLHEYSSSKGGRCLTNYTCKHCGDRYQIDSGD